MIYCPCGLSPTHSSACIRSCRFPSQDGVWDHLRYEEWLDGCGWGLDMEWRRTAWRTDGGSASGGWGTLATLGNERPGLVNAAGFPLNALVNGTAAVPSVHPLPFVLLLLSRAAATWLVEVQVPNHVVRWEEDVCTWWSKTRDFVDGVFTLYAAFTYMYLRQNLRAEQILCVLYAQLKCNWRYTD